MTEMFIVEGRGAGDAVRKVAEKVAGIAQPRVTTAVHSWRRPRGFVSLLAAASLAVTLSACSSSSGAGDQVATQPPTSSGVASLPPGPLAPATHAPAQRPTVTGAPSVSAAPATFGGTVSYPDGLTVTIASATAATMSGSGPGSFPGAPLVVVDLVVHNGTTAAIDLDHSLVSLESGNPRRIGRAFGSEGAVDLSGILAPGADAKGKYVFGVPAAEQSDLHVYIDLDGVHTIAEFAGHV